MKDIFFKIKKMDKELYFCPMVNFIEDTLKMTFRMEMEYIKKSTEA